MSAVTILSTTNLCIGYATEKVVNQIASELNLNLAEGKLIALIGANGVGKSTLLRTLTGIQKPISGSVELAGKPLDGLGASEMAQQISVVLTENLPPSNLTVFELVALGRQPYTDWMGTRSSDDKKMIEWAMEQTQIVEKKKKKHHEISDGQLQRVLISRALPQDTPEIIVDEPTTHLDLLHKVSLLKLLKKLSKETNKCIVFSTHDIDMAIQVADEMIVMTADSVVQDEPCNLISKGTFSKLFDDSSITFDATFGKFIISG